MENTLPFHTRSEWGEITVFFKS